MNNPPLCHHLHPQRTYVCPLSHAGDPISGACLPNIEGVAAGREGETCHTLIIFRGKFSTPSDLPAYLDAILCARRRNRRIVPENEAKGWLGWLHPISSPLPALADPVFFSPMSSGAEAAVVICSLCLFFVFSPPPLPSLSGVGRPAKKTSLVDGDGGEREK